MEVQACPIGAATAACPGRPALRERNANGSRASRHARVCASLRPRMTQLVTRHAAPRCPGAQARFRIGVQRDVGHGRDDVGAGLEDARRTLQRDAADADERDRRRCGASIRRARSRPCGAEAHRLEDRRVDRPERDIVGRDAKRPVELGLVMAADAELQPGRPDRGEIGGVEILLAEMDEVAALRRWRGASSR